jgi:antitoxin CptB
MQEKHLFQRVRWRSRRGLLELDLILGPFTESHFSRLSEGDQDDYVALLDCEDQDVLAWVLGHAKPQAANIAHIVELIKERHGSISASGN